MERDHLATITGQLIGDSNGVLPVFLVNSCIVNLLARDSVNGLRYYKLHRILPLN